MLIGIGAVAVLVYAARHLYRSSGRAGLPALIPSAVIMVYLVAQSISHIPVSIAFERLDEGRRLSKSGRHAEAIAKFKRANHPPQLTVHDDPAREYLAIGDRSSALAEATAEVERRPDERYALELLGDVYMASGDRAKAREMWQKALGAACCSGEKDDLNRKLASVIKSR